MIGEEAVNIIEKGGNGRGQYHSESCGEGGQDPFSHKFFTAGVDAPRGIRLLRSTTAGLMLEKPPFLSRRGGPTPRDEETSLPFSWDTDIHYT